MTSASSQAISKESLLNFRYYSFVRHWGKQVMLTIFKYNFLHGATSSLFKLLKAKGVRLGKKNKSPFNDREIKMLSNNDPLESFDITFLYKICQFLWERNFKDPGDSLKKLMKDIKDERNRISHEEGSIPESELPIKLNVFGDTLKQALDEAYILYSHLGANFNQLQDEILVTIHTTQEKIREKYDPFNPEDVKKFLTEVEDFQDQLHEYVQEKATIEFVELYKDLCRILPFNWLCQYGVTEPSEFMVSLKLQLDEKFDPGISNTIPITLEQKEMLSFKGSLQKDPEVVVLTGNSGLGKTTVLSSIVEKWCKGSSDMTKLASFQTLLYMQFRSHDHDNIEDFLSDLLQRTSSDFNVNIVKASILHSRCLIVCDGYDEVNCKSLKLFKSLLRLKCKERKVVVTTRPQNTKELLSMINQEKLHRIILKLFGVTTENIELHVRMIARFLITDISKRDELVKDVVKAIEAMDFNMLEILKTPLYLNLFVLLYKECPDKRGELASATMLYKNLADHTMKRLIENLGITRDMASKFDKFYRERSFVYHFQEKYEVSEEDAEGFQKKCSELGLDFDSVMSSYFNIKHTKKVLDIVKVYCYRHRSEQEYAAAATISDAIIKYYRNNRNFVKGVNESLVYRALTSSEFFEETELNQVLQLKAKRIVEREKFISEILDLHQTEDEKVCQEATDKKSLLFNHTVGLMGSITEILYHANEKKILYLIIPDVLDKQWELQENEDFGDCVYVDDMIEHCLKTRKDPEIMNAVWKKLNCIFGSVGDESKSMGSTKPETLLLLPQLLKEVKLKSLHLSYSHCYSECNMKSVLDIATECCVKTILSLGMSSASNDTCIKRAETCTDFEGKLSARGVNAIPEDIVMLNLQLELDAVQALPARLHKLKKLVYLALHLSIDGSEDITQVCPLDIPSTYLIFSVSVDAYFDDWSENNVQLLADVINSFWAKRTVSVMFSGLDSLKLCKYTDPSKPRLTGDVIKRLGELITIQGVNINVFLNEDDTEDEQEQLAQYFMSKGIGELKFFLSSVAPGCG